MEAQLERRSLSDEVVRLHEELLDSRKEIDDLVSSQTLSGITRTEKYALTELMINVGLCERPPVSFHSFHGSIIIDRSAVGMVRR